MNAGFYYAIVLFAERPRPREKAEASAVRNGANRRKRYARDFPLFSATIGNEAQILTADQFKQADIDFARRLNAFERKAFVSAVGFHRLCGLVMHPLELEAQEDYFRRILGRRGGASMLSDYWHNALRDFFGLEASSLSNAVLSLMLPAAEDLPDPSPDVGTVEIFDAQAAMIQTKGGCHD
jgi:hypothetical protein